MVQEDNTGDRKLWQKINFLFPQPQIQNTTCGSQKVMPSILYLLRLFFTRTMTTRENTFRIFSVIFRHKYFAQQMATPHSDTKMAETDMQLK
jgi:hypothetical protein